MMSNKKPNWGEYLIAQKAVFGEMGYEPSNEQRAFHESNARVRLVAGGERAGKSFSSAMDMVARAAYTSYLGDHDQLYWILGPDYEQARAEFIYIKDGLEQCGFVMSSKPSMPEGKSAAWVMKIAGLGRISTKTSADITKIASFPPDGIIMAEAAQQEWMAFMKARGRIMEKRGWLILSGTFESSLGWYADSYTAWQNGFMGNRSFSLPTWSNLKIFPGGREDPEIKEIEAVTPADLFMERYGAVPYKPHTLVFRDFSYAKHVREDCVYQEGEPVYLAVDPGYAPGWYHVSAVQFRGTPGKMETVWQVDEIHVQYKTSAEIIAEAKRHIWWKDVSGGVIDVAGKQHHAGKSHVEIWQELAGLHLASNVVPIPDGIERYRTILKDPATGDPRIFHNPANLHTLAEYGKYKREKDKETRGIKETPIDRDNHAMKALAYLLFDRYGPVVRLQRPVGRVATL